MNRCASHVACACLILIVVPGEGLVDEPKQQPAASWLAAVVESELAVRRQSAKLETLLDSPVDVSFVESPFVDTVVWLSEQAKNKIFFDERSLRDAGIATDQPVSLELEGKSLAHVLHRITRPIRAGWTVDRDRIVVTSREEELQQHETRTYRIESLLRAATKREAELVKKLRPGQSLFVPAGSTSSAIRPADGATLQDRLMSFVESATTGPWQNIDGNGATIAATSEHLVVRHNFHAHREIAALLPLLEQALARPVGSPALFVPRGKSDEQKYAKLSRLLEQEVTMQFVETPLDQTLQRLGEELGIEMYFVQNGINLDRPKEAIVFPNVDVTFIADKTRLRVALQQMLAPHRLTFTIHDGAICGVRESPIDDELLATMIYDVADLAIDSEARDDLIETLQAASDAPWKDADGDGGTITELAAGLLVVRQIESAHRDVATTLAELRKAARDAPANESLLRANELETRIWRAKSKDEAKALQRLILTFVAPSSWDGSGGNGLLRTAEDRLLIRQTKPVHEQVEQFLNEYQQAKPLGQSASPIEKKP